MTIWTTKAIIPKQKKNMSESEQTYSIEEEAAILASIGTHSTTRPRSIIEVAEYLQWKLKENPDKDWLKSVVGFKNKEMIDVFLKCLQLPITVQNLFGWEGSRDGKIGLRSAFEIYKLRNPDDEDSLAKAASEAKLTKKEIVDVVQLKLRNPELSVIDCVERVKKLRPIVVKGFAVITSVERETLDSIFSEGNERNLLPNDLLKSKLLAHFEEGEIISIAFRSSSIVLVLNEPGYNRFRNLALQLGVSREDVLQHLLTEN